MRFLLVSYAIGNRVVRSKININKNRQAFMRKAKIVDTIGPATESLEGITSLVEAGMDVARLNRSHGTPEDHLKVYNNLRAAAKATGRNVAALVDLQGPKIRCGWFKKNADGEDKVQLTEGQEFVNTLMTSKATSTSPPPPSRVSRATAMQAIRSSSTTARSASRSPRSKATTCTPRLLLPDRSPATRASTFRASPCLCRL